MMHIHIESPRKIVNKNFIMRFEPKKKIASKRNSRENVILPDLIRNKYHEIVANANTPERTPQLDLSYKKEVSKPRRSQERPAPLSPRGSYEQ